MHFTVLQSLWAPAPGSSASLFTHVQRRCIPVRHIKCNLRTGSCVMRDDRSIYMRPWLPSLSYHYIPLSHRRILDPSVCPLIKYFRQYHFGSCSRPFYKHIIGRQIHEQYRTSVSLIKKLRRSFFVALLGSTVLSSTHSTLNWHVCFLPETIQQLWVTIN